MSPDRLELLTQQAHSRAPLVGAWLRRRATRRLWTRGTPEAIARLATIAALTDDAAQRTHTLGLLGRLTGESAIDAVVGVWARTRSGPLGELILQTRWLATGPMDLRVLNALWLGLHESMADAPPAAVAVLLAATDDVEVRVAEGAAVVLRSLARADAREAVCAAFLDDDSRAARDVALAAGYEPANAARRAVFYFLTGQWERYEGLDFDGAYLRSAYEVAGPGLRQRLAAVARQAGRMEYVAAAAREGRRVGEMTDVEWESAVAVLAGGRRWAELWRLAQAAPPRWSAHIILRLVAEDWQPPAGARASVAALAASARAWRDPDESVAATALTLDGHARPLGGLVVSPDGDTVVTAGEDRTFRIWSLSDRNSKVGQTGGPVTHLAVAPDGRSLASGGPDGVVAFWGLPEGRQTARAPAHVGAVRGMACLPGRPADGPGTGPTLVTAGDDGRVRLFSLPYGRELRTLGVGKQTVPFVQLAVEPSAGWVAAADALNNVHLWDVSRPTADPLWSERARGDEPLVALSFADGGRALAACAGDAVTLVRVPVGKPVHAAASRGGRVTAAVAPAGARYVCAGGAGGRVTLVRGADGAVLRTIDAHAGAVTALAASPDGHLLATGGGEGTVRLYGLPDGHPLANLRDLGGPIRHLAFSAVGGQLLAVVGDDPAVRVWPVEPLRLCRVPLADMTVRDLQHLQAAAGADPRGTAAPAAFVAVLLARRFEHEVMVGDVTPGRIAAGAFDIELA